MVFEYSYWWILPIIALALTVAYFKYKKLSKLPDIGSSIVFLISSLRFLVIFLLLCLLLNPAISLLRHVKGKPLLLIAQDNSISLIKNKDSLFYLNEYRESLHRTVGQLERKFEVVQLTFGSNVKRENMIDYTANRTDLAGVFDYIERNFTYKQPEALLLLTDGIYNKGINPRYKMTAFPVYTVTLGDTTSYPDIYVKNIEADKFNFIHTVFPLKAEIAALKQKGQTIKCILKENEKVLAEKKLIIDKDNYLEEVNFEVEALRKGVAKYTIVIEKNISERTYENNKGEVYVNIIDNSAEVTIYSSAPHPDIAAIVNAANVSGIYKCSVHYFSDTLQELKSNLIILHNPVPGDSHYLKIVEEATKRKIAIWYVLTNAKSISDFARFEKNYTVDLGSDTEEYATIAFNRNFPYFELTDTETASYSAYPPLIVPFGQINTGIGKILFSQRIKGTVTDNGMIAFYENGSNRIAYLWGEGLWKWRLYSYQENGNHELFNTLINKIINYLAVRKGGDRFIHDIKPIYNGSEDVVFNVELYNDSYELINTPDIKLKLKYQDKEFDYLLNRSGDKYRINMGNMPDGEYLYSLSTDLKGERFGKRGIFYVKSRNPEINDIVADKQLLKYLADNSGGKSVSVEELGNLVEILDKSDNFKPTYKNETNIIELSNVGLLGIILLLLLCIEWFLLKYFAG